MFCSIRVDVGGRRSAVPQVRQGAGHLHRAFHVESWCSRLGYEHFQFQEQTLCLFECCTRVYSSCVLSLTICCALFSLVLTGTSDRSFWRFCALQENNCLVCVAGIPAVVVGVLAGVKHEWYRGPEN